MRKTVYEIIKRQNGERFAKAIRNYDNGILDIPGIVDIVKYAGRDAEPIMAYLQSLKDIRIAETVVTETPFELLHRAGYRAEYADTLEKQNSIRKYFKKEEELCTFDDIDRYNKYHIINAVRYDVANIRRADFPSPRREDDYGTSVMSIQIAKDGGFISIKNRYNHSVENPDNTYNSNPDSIISGLSASIKKYFNVDFASHGVDLPDGYARFGTYIVKYNFERQNVYVGDGFYVRSHIIHEINRDYEIQMDCHVFDLRTKKFRSIIRNKDSLPRVLRAEIADRPLQVKTYKNNRGIVCREIAVNNIPLVRTEKGMVTYINLPNVSNVPEFFMTQSAALREVHLPNAISIGADFCGCYGAAVSVFDAPRVQTIDGDFMCFNTALETLNLPNLRTVGDIFLKYNMMVTALDLPMLKSCGADFMAENVCISSINLPQLESVGINFLRSNNKLTNVVLPRLHTAGMGFMCFNESVLSIDLPKLTNVGEYFLSENNRIKNISAPLLQRADSSFLFNANNLKTVIMPNVGHKLVNGRLVLDSVPWGCLMGGMYR